MTHTWKVYNLERTIIDGTVFKVTYACESEDNSIFDRKMGEIELIGSPQKPGFIPFEELTEEIVLGWLSGSIDNSIFETENSVSISEIASQHVLTTTVSGTPW